MSPKVAKPTKEETIDQLRRTALDEDDEAISAKAALALVEMKPSQESLTALVDLILTGRGRWGKRDGGRPPKPWHVAREKAFLLLEKKHALVPGLTGNGSFAMELETDLLESAYVEERKRAARIIGEIGVASKVSALLRALEDRTVRLVALQALLELQAEVAIAPAKEVLAEIKDETERAAFKKALASLERKIAKKA